MDPADKDGERRLVRRHGRRPPNRSEQLATDITTLRMELLQVDGELATTAVSRETGHLRRERRQALVDRREALRAEVRAAVEERRRLRGALPATADRWPGG